MRVHPSRAYPLSWLLLLCPLLLPLSAATQPGSAAGDPACLECAQERRSLEAGTDRLVKLDAELQATQAALHRNALRRLQAEHRIDDIGTRLDDEPGQGGESWDPHTGITLKSYDEGDRVNLDSYGPDGQLIDSTSYPQLAREDLIEERVTRALEIEALKQEEARLRERLAAVHLARSRAETDVEQARRSLRDCVKARCDGTPAGVGVAPKAGHARRAVETAEPRRPTDASGLGGIIG